jgi:hypothetical protein
MSSKVGDACSRHEFVTAVAQALQKELPQASELAFRERLQRHDGDSGSKNNDDDDEATESEREEDGERERVYVCVCERVGIKRQEQGQEAVLVG